MTQFKPTLMIRRMAVYAGGHPAYDESFRPGVNIIRGTNSSGKSTIADFLFFALGGDVSVWKAEAERCNEVLLEALINGTPVTLRRTISRSTRRPMSIFWGEFEKAKASAVEGWQVFPFQRGENKQSFSQVVFRTLGLPEVRSDVENNITMHQILRLIYVDQLSPVENLMRTEAFDTSLTRAAVRDLLFGIYDDMLYQSELRLREKKRELDYATSEFKSVREVLGELGHEIDLENLKKTMSETEDRLVKIQTTIEEISKVQLAEREKLAKKDGQTLGSALLAARQERQRLEADIRALELEIEDSREFIVAIGRRLIALGDSISTREVLGELPITHCPHCLNPLVPTVSTNLCFLCKQPISETSGRSQALRMRQELVFQQNESEGLLKEKEIKFTQLKEALPLIVEKERSLQRQFDAEMRVVRTSRDQRLDALLVQKGNLEGQMQILHIQAKAVGVLERLKTRIKNLEAAVRGLELEIANKRQAQEGRRNEAMENITWYALLLLRSDLPREEFFKTGKSVTVDFEKNSFSVDGRNQFSASSTGYLKNCIHYAIFFASLELEFFRYPRLILCDNMEDKGMEEERSHNFQRVIVDLSKKLDVAHQIIFTTSMIDPSLNKPDLCIGSFYDQTNKSLRF